MTKGGYTIVMEKDISLVEVGQWLFRKCIYIQYEYGSSSYATLQLYQKAD